MITRETVEEEMTVPDVLVRGVSQEAVDRIDAAAAREGLSRNEHLRRQLEGSNEPVERRRVTEADWARFAELTTDLSNPEVMAAAWR